MDVYERCTTGIPGIVINFVFSGHSVLKSVANSGHDGGLVSAVDGDGDDLAGGAIGRDRGEAVGERLGGAELLDRGLAVVGRIGPVAGRIEREGAVGPGEAGLRRE